jgi:hypothetical protein
VIAVGAVVVLAVIAWQLMRRRESDRLKGQFGPEYDRTLQSTESKREAEAELAARQERREQLAIRPLSQTTRTRYLESWRVVQAQFVDDPGAAVLSADSLIQSVMAERGYPVEDFDQRAADVSVDHPDVVENYREGHRLAVAGGRGANATEDLRQAMRHYRALFDELLDGGDDRPAAWDPATNGALSTAGDREGRR